MVQIYYYCFRNGEIWTSDLEYMKTVLAREFGYFQISFIEMDEQQKAESSYPLKLKFHQEGEFMICIKQEFQLFKYDELTNTNVRLANLEKEIINKGQK